MHHRTAAAALVLLLLTGCREEDGFIGGPGGARAYVTSDPGGAEIFVDSKQTGRFTPDTITGLTGRHDLTVRLDTLDTSYRYTAQIVLSNPDSIAQVAGPLTVRCSTTVCYRDLFRHYAANRLRFAVNPAGTLFLADGSGGGLVWPSPTNNSYASGGIPMFSAIMRGDTVALGIYDTNYLAGRPVPQIVQDGERVWLQQATWIVPPADVLQFSTVRGIRIEESVLSTRTVDDVVIIKLVFHNITDQPLYRLVDPFLPVAGVTFENAYVGFALDPDIGTSTDDMLSYDSDLDMAFAYDARFDEDDFGGGFNRAPGLVGLRMIDAPPTVSVIMNGWSRQQSGGDWFAGMVNEGSGWGMMSGRRVYAPDHSSPRIGHLPPGSSDVRLVVSAGPFTLAPGDSAAITVAVVVAQPLEGTFTPGTLVDPGNPLDPNRVLNRIATRLFERARAAEGMLNEQLKVESLKSKATNF
jgi:hypothetical protein